MLHLKLSFSVYPCDSAARRGSQLSSPFAVNTHMSSMLKRFLRLLGEIES
jgi:hypothetical protein